MKRLTNPELKIIRFASEDVIATSLGPLSGLKGGFYIPSSLYNGGSLGGNYVEFQGTFGDYDGSAYNITNANGFKADVNNDRDGLTSGGSYTFPDVGITVDMSDMAPIAQQYYDAFSYGDGQYYTNGISYYDQYWQ